VGDLLEVRSTLLQDSYLKVEVSEMHKFDPKTSIKEYKELFKDLKAGGQINNEQFSDITWYLPCLVTFRNVEIPFDTGGYSSFSAPLKSFALLQRLAGKRPGGVKRNILQLKEVIIRTDGLQDREKLKEYFSQPVEHNGLYLTGHTLLNFLHFYQLPDIQRDTLEIVEGLALRHYGNRDLPPFEDVLVFDECINGFFAALSVKDSLRFYPIYLWWVITNIIPMRRIEFIRIKSDCLDVKDDGSYWITIHRYKKQTTDLDEVYWIQPMVIDKNIYMLIKEYLNILNSLGIQSEYLIPEMSKINSRLKGPLKSLNKDAATEHQFHKLIHFFYEEIVEGKFNEYHLDRVTPGDTRHFSIINLFLQGFNSLTIARLAGHREIETPSNYFSHAVHFATSAVYKLSQRKIEGDIGSRMKDGFLGRRDYQVRKANANLGIEMDPKKSRRVDYGYCKDIKEFPNNCVEDCRYCETYYEFRPSINDWNEGIKWLESYSRELEKKAFNALDMMAMVSKKTYDNLKGIEKLDESDSKSMSVQFFKYLDQKAIVDARILTEKLAERVRDE
jgi:hypothetical protein